MPRWLADGFPRDLQHGLRALLRTPGFAASAILILGLGIGMASAMFSVFDAVLLRSPPVRDQNRIAVLWGDGPGTLPHFPLLHPWYRDLRDGSQALAMAAGVVYNGVPETLYRLGDGILALRTAGVTGNFFSTLGTTPRIGRLLRPEDDVVGAPLSMVISENVWRRYFGGDPDVVGKRLVVSGSTRTYTIAGVVPAGLDYPAGADAWVPVVPTATPPGSDSTSAFLDVVGRLAPGATWEQARTEYLGALRESTRSGNPALSERLSASVHPLRELVVGEVRPAVVALTVAVALLLLIACANIGNLLLVRAAGRSQEIAIRRVLGAGFGRLVRQLFAESLVLGILGGALGLFVGHGLLRTLLALAPAELPHLDLIRLAGAPFVMVTGVTLASTLLFGLAPAVWAARRDLGTPLRAGTRGGGPGRAGRRVRQALVAWQVALALVVLAGAGLVTRSLVRLQRLDLGFNPDRLLLVQFAWPWAHARGLAASRDLMQGLLTRIEEVPGVTAATPIIQAPFSGTGGLDGTFIAEGRSEAEAGATPFVNIEAVGPGYLRTFDLALENGRAFNDGDRENASRVALVSRQLAQQLWPGQDPVGKRLRFNNRGALEEWWTVVGTVAGTHYRQYRDPAPTIYFPYRQFAGYVTRIALRTEGDPLAVLPAIRRAVQEVDPDVDVWKADPMERLLDGPLAEPRLNTLLLSAFGLAALLLAAMGLYGAIATSVRQQTRDIGVRLALGATPGALRGLVLSQALAVASLGTAAGLAGALGLSRLLSAILFQVSPIDPLTLAAASGLLLAVALLAAYIPARRATRIDPVQALRAE